MTPREELSAKMSEEFCLGTVSAATRIEREILKPFAIGRWVSVDERLPKNGWQGLVKRRFGLNPVQTADFSMDMTIGPRFRKITDNVRILNCTVTNVTHWLELDMPKQPNEKGE